MRHIGTDLFDKWEREGGAKETNVNKGPLMF